MRPICSGAMYGSVPAMVSGGAGACAGKLVDLPHGPRIRGVSWTPDSSSLILGQHDTLSDIVLLEQVQ